MNSLIFDSYTPIQVTAWRDEPSGRTDWRGDLVTQAHVEGWGWVDYVNGAGGLLHDGVIYAHYIIL